MTYSKTTHKTANASAIIILAAGKSTRFAVNSKQSNKLDAQLAGKPILHYTIDTAIKLQPKRIIILVSQTFSQDNKDYILKKYNNIVDIIVQEQQNGTAGAVEIAINHIQTMQYDINQIITLYADTPFITEQTIRNMSKNTAAASAATMIINSTHQYGRIILDDNGFKSVSEYKEYSRYTEQQKNQLSNLSLSGCFIFNLPIKQLLSLIQSLETHLHGEKYLTDILKNIRDIGQDVFLYQISEDEGIGINTPENYVAATKIVKENLIKQAINQGAVLHSIDNISLQYDTILEPGCQIHPYVIFGEKVIVKATGVILPFSVIHQSIIAGTVGPFAHIRSDTEVKEKAVVGAFVETKNAVFGENSKAKHLAYLGDIEIGTDVNIGAMSVTCNYNYDTKKKAQTILENNTSVGAHTCLIAPVTLKAGSMTCAGSTITKTIEENQMGVSRTPQRNIRRIKLNTIK